eukprot:CAMPEP_0172601342 /NCGR_PEP_ID=MMETSP1068-20121228/21488_1 /TAXON_ID=35684 /ORGANISM="Pseudopedinella elastica, Strain CCMP716" /LENGTH=124 /DNA_ID=CAMNT_0013402293 /DNA_START=105 /DNA_END=476 /DNA_ORIENTATION=-
MERGDTIPGEQGGIPGELRLSAVNPGELVMEASQLAATLARDLAAASCAGVRPHASSISLGGEYATDSFPGRYSSSSHRQGDVTGVGSSTQVIGAGPGMRSSGRATKWKPSWPGGMRTWAHRLS